MLPPHGTDTGTGRWWLGELMSWSRRLGQTAPDRPDRPDPVDLPEPFALQLAGEWAAAAQRWRELGRPYEAACALAESGLEADLRAALAELQRLEARPAAARVSRRRREMGARSVTRGPSATTRAN